MFLFLCVICIIVLLYLYATRNFNYWKVRGVPYSKPWLFAGSFPMTILRVLPPTEDFKRIYDQHSDAKYYGIFIFHSPSLVIKDAELIKQILVKDFDHFSDHTALFINPETDPLLSKNLFSLAGNRWKDMRSTLSPAFTSAKMKMMFGLMVECGEQAAEFYLNECKKQANNQIDVELRDVFGRFANDVIATSAFGIKCNSLKDRDNEFYKMGEFASQFHVVRILAKMFLPSVMKMLGEGFIPGRVQRFFRSIIQETLRTREKYNIVRPDIIHLLIESKKGRLQHESNKNSNEDGFAVVAESEVGLESSNKIELSDEDITAQAIAFFFAGFDSVSMLLCFAGHELAIHPDIQLKLHMEIDETLEKCNGKINYNALLHMKYLDMVVSETLRKWPSAIVSDRVCTKDYTLKTEDGTVHLKKGDSISILIHAIHHDEKYYSNAKKFDPERFNDENKKKIHNFAYLPFGVGPRGCIGSRFALMEIKIALFYLLAHFDFVVTKRTEVPLKLLKSPFRLGAQNGFWIGFKLRKCN